MTDAKSIHNQYVKSLREWEKSYQMYLWTRYMQSCVQCTTLPHRQSQPATQIPPPQNQRAPARDTVPAQGLLECYPASIPKRFFAELIDGVVLIIAKALTIALAMELFEIEDMDLSLRFLVVDTDSELTSVSIEEFQYMLAVGLSYRLLTCFYEAMFVYWQGQTIGKLIFGLEVVQCAMCVRRENAVDRAIIVIPGSKISFSSSWIRAVCKNFTIALFIPTFVTMFFYRHRRTTYDIISKSIVIERRNQR